MTSVAVRLRNEAIALDAVVGEPPSWSGTEDYTWHGRRHMAADALRLLADNDAGALRAAMGSLWTSFDPQPSWRSLLALAAIKIERGFPLVGARRPRWAMVVVQLLAGGPRRG